MKNSTYTNHNQGVIAKNTINGKVLGGSRLPGSFLFVECLSGFFTIKKNQHFYQTEL